MPSTATKSCNCCCCCCCRRRRQSNYIQHGSSKNCLAISEDKKKITVERCSPDNPRVKWKFANYDASKKL